MTKDTARHKRKITPISKVLPNSCTHSSLCLQMFMEKAAWRGEGSHLEKLLCILPRGARTAAARGEWQGTLISHRPRRGCRCPLHAGAFGRGLLATPFEITECWKHRFNMNMQMRMFESPTSCLWIFLKIQPLTMTNKK